LADSAGRSLFSTGGSFRPEACSIIGPGALETIQGIQVESRGYRRLGHGFGNHRWGTIAALGMELVIASVEPSLRVE